MEIDRLTSLRRQVRLTMLLNAAEHAGIAPLQITRLHAFAYLSNVLAPVWYMPALDGSLLKLRGGPFYPLMQLDLDRLVGMGLAIISDLNYLKSDDGRWRLEGAYRLNYELAHEVLDAIHTYDEERQLSEFIEELAFALSALSDKELDMAFVEDATYSDPMVGVGNVIDFAEWSDTNYSARAATYFDRLVPGAGHATPGEKLHLYVRHLHRRIVNGS